MHHLRLTVCVAALLGCRVVAAAEPATITTSATTEEVMRPSTAQFSVAVESFARNAAAAREGMTRSMAAVRDALRAAGLADSEVKSSSINVGAHWLYGRDDGPRRDGYEAKQSLVIETRQLENVGLILDAALNGGAKSLSPVTFQADDETPARERALKTATAKARNEARTLAEAAGGHLGALLAISTRPFAASAAATDNGQLEEVVVTGMYRKSAAPITTEVVVPDLTVRAFVAERWAFVPNGQ